MYSNQCYIAESLSYFPEKLLYQSWLQLEGGYIRAGSTVVSILFPGYRNQGSGPDFKDALLLLNDEIQRGDIELHGTVQDWYRHGHHQNPAYEGVILHVVYHRACEEPVYDLSGRAIPTIYLPLSPVTRAHKVCPEVSEDKLKSVLIEYGHRRVEGFISGYLSLSLEEELSELLYQETADVLGYSHYRHLFQAFTTLIPLKEVFSTLTESLDIPGCRDHLWALFQRRLIARSGKLEFPLIHTSGCSRPANRPEKRLLALLQFCHLLLRKKFILCLEQLHHFSNTPGRLLQYLRDLFYLPGMGYLLGKGRLIEWLTNLLIPLQIARARKKGDNQSEAQLWKLLQSLPSGETIGQLTRLLKQLSLPDLKLSALEKQGLLHIHKNYCTGDFCSLCPLRLSIQSS